MRSTAPAQAGDLPVVGDWAGIGTDRIGIYLHGAWYLDLDGNGGLNTGGDRQLGKFGQPGDLLLVGRW